MLGFGFGPGNVNKADLVDQGPKPGEIWRDWFGGPKQGWDSLSDQERIAHSLIFDTGWADDAAVGDYMGSSGGLTQAEIDEGTALAQQMREAYGQPQTSGAQNVFSNLLGSVQGAREGNVEAIKPPAPDPAPPAGGNAGNTFNGLLDTVTGVQDGTITKDEVMPDGWNPGSPINGGGGTPTGGPVEWNWDVFTGSGAPSLEGGGGERPGDYDYDYYVPGEESPWGIPEIEGGNRDFYRNQFVNLLDQEQSFQQGQRRAATNRWIADAIRSGADKPPSVPQDRWDAAVAANTPAPLDSAWDWIEGGLPEVTLGTGRGVGAEGEPEWQPYNSDWVGRDVTMAEVYGDISSRLDPSTKQFFDIVLAAPGQNGNPSFGEGNVRWMFNEGKGFGNPGAVLGAWRQNFNAAPPGAKDDLINAMFTQVSQNPGEGLASITPVGYAAPVAGFGG